MKCQYAVVFISQLLIVGFGIVRGDNCYGAQFSEDVWPCDGFENEMIQCDTLKLGAVEGNEAELGLSGSIGVKKTIEDGIKVNVEIWKVTDIGKEFMYHVGDDMCSNLKDNQTAWYPLIESMKITSCPIAVDDYAIKDMTINLGPTSSIMTHEFCGEYIVELSTSQGESSDKQSCYEMGVSISEYEC